MRLLLVEDDVMIGEGLRNHLRGLGYHVALLVQRDGQRLFVPIDLG